MKEQSPDKADHSGNAQGASQVSSLDEMKSILEARVKEQPENAEAWRELAQTKMMLGDVNGAENDCIECLRLEPANAPGLVLMGNLLTNFRKDDAAAERYYARTVEADLQSATAHIRRTAPVHPRNALEDDAARIPAAGNAHCVDSQRLISLYR